MKTYENLNEFRRDLFSVAVPDDLANARIDVATTGSLNRTGDFLMEVYLARATISADLAQVAAGALGVFAQSGFLEIGQSGDAARMRLALLRDAGEPAPEGMSWPDPSEDPFQPEPPEQFD